MVAEGMWGEALGHAHRSCPIMMLKSQISFHRHVKGRLGDAVGLGVRESHGEVEPSLLPDGVGAIDICRCRRTRANRGLPATSRPGRIYCSESRARDDRQGQSARRRLRGRLRQE